MADLVRLTSLFGRLPEEYTRFLQDMADYLPFQVTYRGEGAAEHRIMLYSPSQVVEGVGASPADPAKGLLVIGDEGAFLYVLDTTSAAVYGWEPSDNDWGDGIEKLRRIATHVEDVLRAKRVLEHTPYSDDHHLEILATGPLENVQSYLREHGVDEMSPGSATLAERAAMHGRRDILNACLKAGSNTARLTAFAVRGGQVELLRHLVDDLKLSLSYGKGDRVLASPEMRRFLRERGGSAT